MKKLRIYHKENKYTSKIQVPAMVQLHRLKSQGRIHSSKRQMLLHGIGCLFSWWPWFIPVGLKDRVHWKKWELCDRNNPCLVELCTVITIWTSLLYDTFSIWLVQGRSYFIYFNHGKFYLSCHVLFVSIQNFMVP